MGSLRALLVLCAICGGWAHAEARARPLADLLHASARRPSSGGPRMAVSGGRRSLSARVRSQLARLSRIGGRLSSPLSGGSRSRDGGGGAGGDPHLATLASGGAVSAGAAQRRPGGKLRILFLISDTGGGHRASAQALEAALQELYPGEFEFATLDIWTLHSRWPYNKCVPGYRFLAKRPMAWRLIWFYSVFLPTRTLQTLAVKGAGIVPRFRAALELASPDLVVSMHPLTQDLPLDALDQLGGGRRTVPFVTVVTDLGSAHPHWFDRRVDACFVPSEALVRQARRRGLSEGQIRLRGLPIRPTFWQSPKGKPETRRALGLKTDMDTVLVVGGGDGVGDLGPIVSQLADCAARRRPSPTQIVVVCGRNRALCRALQARTWPAGVRVVVHGFVSQMSDFMAAADVLVTKAGPGTIAEASARGLPVMLSSFLPGQEAGNVPYVISGGFGSYRRRVRSRARRCGQRAPAPRRIAIAVRAGPRAAPFPARAPLRLQPGSIASAVVDWLDSPQQLAAMSQNALAASRPLATYEIAHDIGARKAAGRPGERARASRAARQCGT